MGAYRKTVPNMLAVMLSASFLLSPAAVPAQEPQHIVPASELARDAVSAKASRQGDEAAIRALLTSEAGQKALATAKVEYAKVEQAIGQLSDEDTARLAERSRGIQADFAAGSLSDRDLLVIVIIAVLIIALIAALH